MIKTGFGRADMQSATADVMRLRGIAGLHRGNDLQWVVYSARSAINITSTRLDIPCHDRMRLLINMRRRRVLKDDTWHATSGIPLVARDFTLSIAPFWWYFATVATCYFLPRGTVFRRCSWHLQWRSISLTESRVHEQRDSSQTWRNKSENCVSQ